MSEKLIEQQSLICIVNGLITILSDLPNRFISNSKTVLNRPPSSPFQSESRDDPSRRPPDGQSNKQNNKKGNPISYRFTVGSIGVLFCCLCAEKGATVRRITTKLFFFFFFFFYFL